MRSPILVLGSGHRCGTTLVQRLLNSHPDILVWGEHGGILRALLDSTHALERWDEELGEQSRAEHARSSYQGWIANLLPGAETIDEAARAYVRAMFAEPAGARGRHGWGFKEVRYGLGTAQQLRALFPEAVVVHVIRDPRDVLRSLEWWERKRIWTRAQMAETLGFWLAVSREFLGAREGAPEAGWVVSVRYEDLVADPHAFIQALATLTDIDPDQLDASVFEVKVHGDGEEGRARRRLKLFHELDPEIRALLDPPEFAEVASRYGYDLASTPASRPLLGSASRLLRGN